MLSFVANSGAEVVCEGCSLVARATRQKQRLPRELRGHRECSVALRSSVLLASPNPKRGHFFGARSGMALELHLRSDRA